MTRIIIKDGLHRGKYKLVLAPERYLGIQSVYSLNKTMSVEIENDRVFLRYEIPLNDVQLFTKKEVILEKSTDEAYSLDEESAGDYFIYINNDNESKSMIINKNKVFKRILLEEKDFEFKSDGIIDSLKNIFWRN